MTAVQASMSPEQIQDIVLGTVHGMMTNGDLVNEMQRDTAMNLQEDEQQGMQMEQPMQPQDQPMPEEMPPQGMPQ